MQVRSISNSLWREQSNLASSNSSFSTRFKLSLAPSVNPRRVRIKLPSKMNSLFIKTMSTSIWKTTHGFQPSTSSCRVKGLCSLHMTQLLKEAALPFNTWAKWSLQRQPLTTKNQLQIEEGFLLLLKALILFSTIFSHRAARFINTTINQVVNYTIIRCRTHISWAHITLHASDKIQITASQPASCPWPIEDSRMPKTKLWPLLL